MRKKIHTVNHSQWKGENSNENTTRLLCGSAYRRGIRGALELLGNLRSHPYKAKSPESRLNLNSIVLHSIQSVTISVMFATVAITLGLMQMLFYKPHYNPEVFDFFNLIGSLITAYELIYLRWAITYQFLKKSYNPNFQPNLPLFSVFLQPLIAFFQLHIIEPEPTQNVIISGGYTPFLGSGGQISRWTLAIDRKPAKDKPKEVSRIDIPVNEFYKAADQEVASLNLPNLKAFFHLFVRGFELEVDGKIVPNLKTPPVSNLPENEILTLGQKSLSNECRAYRLYRYIDNERDQMLSYFLRFYNVGSITFVESSTHILPCIDRKRFSLTPVLEDSKTSRFIKMLSFALVLFLISYVYLRISWSYYSAHGYFLIPMTGVYFFVGIGYLSIFTWAAVKWWLENRRKSREANWQEEYNYGHTKTFRESISSQYYESYYSVQDLTMYWKSLQEAILSSIVELLKQYDVDTSQFEQVVSNIINSGIMVSGGNFSADQVVAGMGASAVVNNNSQQQTNPLKQVKSRITANHNSD